jgi:hypothetical protein
MPVDPHTFFRFAAQNFPLLRDLYYRQSVGDADLRELIVRHRVDNGPTPDYIAGQLVEFSILETTPDATASYEMTRPVRNLLRFLLKEQRLTSAAVIQGYLDDLEQSQAELEAAISESRPVRIERALSEIGETLERIRQDSRANREAVINDVLSLKSNQDRRTAKERFEIINRLWTHYLEPLRDLIDVRKAMDAGLDSLDRVLRAGAKTFDLDGALSREFSRCRARLLRLRREIGIDFHECLREVEPLYESLKRDSELVRGAVRALERIGKEGIKSLALADLLTIPFWQQEGLLSDMALESYFHGVRGYVPRALTPLATSPDVPGRIFIDPKMMLDKLIKSLPVDDVLHWLVTNYDAIGPGEVLRAYGRIHSSGLVTRTFSGTERAYVLGEVTLLAHPLRIEANA